MRIKTGYLYHIKDEFFKNYPDYNLMQNHELGRTRPTYFTIKDKDILWFIPLSTKLEKYQKIVDRKIKKYGSCDTILIRKILNNDVAILIQNAFPTLEKYVDHIHTIHSLPAKVNTELKEEILINFKKMLNMKKHSIDLFFVDIDKLKEKLLDEETINS